MALALINVIDKTQLGVKGHCRQRCLVAKWSGCSVTDRVRVRCRAREWFFFFGLYYHGVREKGMNQEELNHPPCQALPQAWFAVLCYGSNRFGRV